MVDGDYVFLSTMPATPAQRRLALGTVIVSTLLFAMAAPFAREICLLYKRYATAAYARLQPPPANTANKLIPYAEAFPTYKDSPCTGGQGNPLTVCMGSIKKIDNKLNPFARMDTLALYHSQKKESAMFYFKTNLPRWERVLRIIAGLLLAWLAYGGLVTGVLNWLLIASAATMVLTAFAGFCPACALAGRKYLGK